MKKNKKIAILFHGLVYRSLKHTVSSFEHNILTPLQKKYDVDVFHHSWKISVIHNPRGGEYSVPIDQDAISKFMPYSKGVEEDQNEYDHTIDPSFFTKKNPMHNCTTSEEDALITAMNSLRDLESTKRAFKYMENNSNDDYDYIIVCRPDVEFLNKFKISRIKDKIIDGVVFIPYFDKGVDGSNDRFVIGNRDSIKIYCNRIDGALEWMKYGLVPSSEDYLKKHLVDNNIEIKDIPLFFRRIRANGEIFHKEIASMKISFKLPIFFIIKHVYKEILSLRNKKNLDRISQGDSIKNKIIIAGIENPRNIFLIRIFTELGFDTGYSGKNILADTSNDFNIGLGDYATSLVEGKETTPYIVESSHFSDKIPLLNKKYRLDRVIIPIRDSDDIDSMLMSDIRDGNIPHILLQFPDFLKEPEYLYNKLLPILSEVSLKRFKKAFWDITTKTK